MLDSHYNVNQTLIKSTIQILSYCLLRFYSKNVFINLWPGEGKKFEKIYKCFYLVFGLEKKIEKNLQVFLFGDWPGQEKFQRNFYKCFYLVSGLEKEKF